MVSKIKSIFHPESFWGRWCQWFDMFFKGMEKNTYFEKTPKAKRTPQKRNKLGKKCHPKTRVVFRPLRLRCFLLVGGRLAQKFVSQKFAANRMWNNVSSCQHFCWMVFEARILSTGISQEWCEMNICIFWVINTYFHTGYLGFYNPLPYYNFGTSQQGVPIYIVQLISRFQSRWIRTKRHHQRGEEAGEDGYKSLSWRCTQSNEQWPVHPGWWGYIRDATSSQLYRDYFISQYKDPVIEPSRI